MDASAKQEDQQTVAVILGSAYQESLPEKMEMTKRKVATAYGEQTVYQVDRAERSANVIFRHGLPHRLLPNQIPYRRQAAALRKLNCGALLVTSSVGVLHEDIPLYTPLLVDDLIMLENQLPDGSACTMFTEPTEEHGHLVFQEGPFSDELNRQIETMGEDTMKKPVESIVFAYVQGPRGKTTAENRLWPKLGAHVNSMTFAPEVILANECEIPTAGLVVGHKYSMPDRKNPESVESVSDSLDNSRQSMEQIIETFITSAEPVAFGNQIYRFNS